MWLPLALTVALAGDDADPTGPDPAPAEEDGGLVAPRLAAPLQVAWPEPADPDLGPQTVLLEILVGEDGRVEEVEVVAGVEPFVAAVQAALADLHLIPASDGGIPVAVRVPLQVVLTPPALSLEGVVRVSGGGDVARGVVLEVGGRQVTTDAEGRFALRGLKEGAFTVTGRLEGHVLAPATIEIVPGEVVELTLWAVPESADPGIVASYRRGRPDVSRRSLTAEEVRTLPGTLGDPLRAVTNLPGVARSPLETGWLLVRGGDPRDTAVYVDGVRVPLVHHLGGFTSVVHPAFVDRVDFLPGGGGVRYGRATAGAVDLVTRGAGARPEARVGANLVFASAWGGASAGEVTLAGSVRRSYLDAVLSPFLPEESRGAIPRFWDWQARADLPGDASIFAFGFVDAVTVPGQDGAEAEIEVATQRLHGRASVPVGEKSLVLTPFLAWEHLLFEIADWNDRTARDHWGGGLRAELADEGSGPSGWSGGVDAELFSASLSSSGLRRDLPVAMPDLYVDGRLGEGTASHLVAGVRLDTLLVGDQPSRVGLSPRLSGTLQVAPRSAADLSVGVSHQPPPWEFVLGPPEGAVLELDEAVNVALGVRHGAGPVDGGAEGWFRLVNRRTALEADGSIGQGEGYAVGLDVHSTLRAGRLDALAKIGLASSQVREHADEEYRPSEYDQPLTVGVAAAYDLGRFWTAGARFRYASGFPVGAEGTVAVDFLTLQEVELAANSRVDDFHSLDLKISKRFLFRTWRLDAFLDVQNVYNRRVPEPAITGFANVSLSGMGYGLMTLPIFGVEGQFGGDPRRP